MPNVTRQRFNLIAGVVACLDVDDATRAMIAERFAKALHDASPYNINGNKSFDTERFVKACGRLAHERDPSPHHIAFIAMIVLVIAFGGLR